MMATFNMPSQDNRPTETTAAVDKSINHSTVNRTHLDTTQHHRLSQHINNNNTAGGNTKSNESNNNRPARTSFLPPANRRSTMAFRNVDHSQPPMEDPNNSPELNARRRREYERVQQLNHMIETVILDFEHAADNIKSFNSVLDETDQLLDLWTQILSLTQDTKRLLDAPSIDKVERQEPISVITTAGTAGKPTTGTRASPLTAIKKQKAAPVSVAAPVGTHMTKKRKT